MKLNQIANNPGAHKRKDKLGRGSSSGLGKIRRTRTLEDTPSVRGMINAVKHLVEIVEESK